MRRKIESPIRLVTSDMQHVKGYIYSLGILGLGSRRFILLENATNGKIHIEEIATIPGKTSVNKQDWHFFQIDDNEKLLWGMLSAFAHRNNLLTSNRLLDIFFDVHLMQQDEHGEFILKDSRDGLKDGLINEQDKDTTK